MVSAPTSSGKTLIAEAAAVATVARGRRLFYTTPLKALSNQKFREFRYACLITRNFKCICFFFFIRCFWKHGLCSINYSESICITKSLLMCSVVSARHSVTVMLACLLEILQLTKMLRF